MGTRKILLLFVMLYSTSNVSKAQDFFRIAKEDTLQRDRVLKSNVITHYGIDFSHFELVEEKKVGTEILVHPYIGEWIKRITVNYVDENNLAYFSDRTVEHILEPMQRLYLKRKTPWIKIERTPLLLDSVRKIVNTTNFPAASNEIGLLVIVEAFVKNEEAAYLNFVFFDTRSKEVLWRVKLVGSNKQIGGMTKRWSNGIEECYQGFLKYWRQETRSIK